MAEVFQLSSLFEDAYWQSICVSRSSVYQRAFRELQSKGGDTSSLSSAAWRVIQRRKSGLFLEGHSRRSSGTMEGQRHKLQQGKFRLNIRKKFFTVRAVKKNGTGFPERLWDLHPWRCSNFNWLGPEQLAVTLKSALL